jgi:hypothetical protein
MAEDQPYTFLFVPLGISALREKFVLVGKDSAGKEIFRPIKMEKAGLTYDLIQWGVREAAVLEK